MPRLTKRDAFATVIVAAVVVPNVGYVVRGSMPFIQDPRGMAGVGLVGLLLAWWAAGGRSTFSGRLQAVAAIIGLVAVGLGIASLAATSEVRRVAFIGAVVVLWALFMLVHAGALMDGRTGPTARHA
jgi:hypothetical protein